MTSATSEGRPRAAVETAPGRQAGRPQSGVRVAGAPPGISRIRVARGFWARLAGLMFRSDFPQDEGLLFERCHAIHTCFMRFPIDATFLDGAGRAVKTVRNIPPWRLCVFGGPGAESVLETKARGAGSRSAPDACFAPT